MLVECRGHARALCRISVAELRRVAPPAFSLLMVVSLLLADGLLPVLAVKYRTEAALYSSSVTARSNTFIGGEWSAHAMAAVGGRTLSNHKRTRVKSYEPNEAGGGAEVKAKHHGHDAKQTSQSNVSSSTTSTPRAKSSSPSPSTPHPIVCSNNSTTNKRAPRNSGDTSREQSPGVCQNTQLQIFHSPEATRPGEEKCRSLKRDTVASFCSEPSESWRLLFCDSYTAISVYNRSANCNESLHAALDQEEKAKDMYKHFSGLMSRVNCRTNYSAKWNCKHCENAYKDWLCSTQLHYFQANQRWPPCSQFCESVEERCPFFRPNVTTQAGDPSFICKDHHMNLPNIYLDKDCYRPCHLWWGTEELEKRYCNSFLLPNSSCSLRTDCKSPNETFTAAPVTDEAITTGASTTTSIIRSAKPSNSSLHGQNATSAGRSSGASATPWTRHRTHSSPLLGDALLRLFLTLFLSFSHFRYLITELT